MAVLGNYNYSNDPNQNQNFILGSLSLANRTPQAPLRQTENISLYQPLQNSTEGSQSYLEQLTALANNANAPYDAYSYMGADFSSAKTQQETPNFQTQSTNQQQGNSNPWVRNIAIQQGEINPDGSPVTPENNVLEQQAKVATQTQAAPKTNETNKPVVPENNTPAPQNTNAPAANVTNVQQVTNANQAQTGAAPQNTNTAAPQANTPANNQNDIPNGFNLKETQTFKGGSVKIYKDANGATIKIKCGTDEKINSVLKTNENGKKISVANYKDGKKTDATDYDPKTNKATKSIEYGDDGTTQTRTTVVGKDGNKTETTYGKDGDKNKVTIKTFNEKGALISSKTGTGDKVETAEAQAKDEKTEDATKGGTARATDKSLDDAALIDQDIISKLAKNGDLKKLTSNLEIKDANGKVLAPEKIEAAFKSGDLELYQNKDGDYSVNSKVEKDVEKYSIAEKKDFFSKAMDSGDPMQMMMAMFFMNMMSGMGGMGSFMGNGAAKNALTPYFDQFQQQAQAQGTPKSGREALQQKGIFSFFDGSYRKGREEARAAKIENEFNSDMSPS